MLPVSGALQLNTSEAHTLRPICSLKKAYSRLLRPLQGTQTRFRGASLRSYRQLHVAGHHVRREGQPCVIGGSVLYLLAGCSKKHMLQNSHCMDGSKPVLWQHQQIYSLCL